MTGANWHLAHSLLSPAINIGLLLPAEVCDAVEERYHEGGVPLSSAEGFIRQVIGWREYVWGLYWLWGSDYAESNHLGADRDLPPAYLDPEATEMRCLSVTIGHVQQNGWAHHIERLVVLANIANLAGVRPQALVDWMTRSFVDAADWVMVPNVIGMGLWADGGRMATKPYVSGGAYMNRMSDHCGDCRFDPKKAHGRRRLSTDDALLGLPRAERRRARGQPPHGAPARQSRPSLRRARRARASHRGAGASGRRRPLTGSRPEVRVRRGR